MAKHKAAVLLQEIAALTPAAHARGNPPWWVGYTKDNPNDSSSLRDVCQDWLSKGRSREVFPSKSSLFRYLMGKDSERPRARFLPERLSYHSFTKYMRHLEENA